MTDEAPEYPRDTLHPPLLSKALLRNNGLDPDDPKIPRDEPDTATLEDLREIVQQVTSQAEEELNAAVARFRRTFVAPSQDHGLQQDERARVLAAGWRACGLDQGSAIARLDDCIPTVQDLILPAREDLEDAYKLLELSSGRIPPEILDPAVALVRSLLRKCCGIDPGPMPLRPQEGKWPTPYVPPEVVALAGLLPPAQPSVVDVSADDATAHRVPLTAADLMARGNDIIEWFRAVLRSNGPPPLQFLGIGVVWDVPVPSEQWIIGDLHGDLLALECSIEVIQRLAGQEAPHILFLGDVFDDGGYGVETVLRVLELSSARPGTITWIAGNHDDAFGYDEAQKSFYSTVIPCDFADLVNNSPEGSPARGAASVAAWLAARLPRALLFEDGLLAAHGGFPLPDLWPMLNSSKDLARPEALRDFTWARAHDRLRNRMPTRIARNSDFGRDDLAMFASLMSRLLDGRPVHRLIRGHDHVVDRFNLHPTYQRVPMRTINALSRRLPREIFGPYCRAPVVARHRPGETPVIYRIHIPDEAVYSAFPLGKELETKES